MTMDTEVSDVTKLYTLSTIQKVQILSDNGSIAQSSKLVIEMSQFDGNAPRLVRYFNLYLHSWALEQWGTWELAPTLFPHADRHAGDISFTVCLFFCVCVRRMFGNEYLRAPAWVGIER